MSVATRERTTFCGALRSHGCSHVVRMVGRMAPRRRMRKGGTSKNSGLFGSFSLAMRRAVCGASKIFCDVSLLRSSRAVLMPPKTGMMRGEVVAADESSAAVEKNSEATSSSLATSWR